MKKAWDFFLNIVMYVGLGLYYCYVGIVITWDWIRGKK